VFDPFDSGFVGSSWASGSLGRWVSDLRSVGFLTHALGSLDSRRFYSLGPMFLGS